MAILRRITASDVTASEAHPQMHLHVPDLYAILADVLRWLGDLDFI
jgi:hypothetical protein